MHTPPIHLAILASESVRGLRTPFGGYTAAMSIDRILISLGVLLLVVSAVLAAITWL